MNNINLELLAVDGKARVNKVKINKHEFNTPIFMPVATRGSIKSVNLEQLSDTKIILGNTYHLYLRPGLDIIKDFGGLHEYCLLYTSPSPRDCDRSRMPSSA